MPESELPPVPEDDDLNDGSSVIDVCAVNAARRKRVEVSQRKLSESDRNIFRKGRGVGASVLA